MGLQHGDPALLYGLDQHGHHGTPDDGQDVLAALVLVVFGVEQELEDLHGCVRAYQGAQYTLQYSLKSRQSSTSSIFMLLLILLAALKYSPQGLMGLGLRKLAAAAVGSLLAASKPPGLRGGFLTHVCAKYQFSRTIFLFSSAVISCHQLSSVVNIC